jgi:triosephosphate isomerase
MPRKPFIAGNWKMNTTSRGAVELATALARSIGSLDAVDLAVCPPFVYLSAVKAALAGSRIALGAQDVFHEDDGAFTGEVSTAMLKDVGCRYVIIGHSERRHVLGETDEMINRKIIKTLAAGLEVIFCVGELLEERKSGLTMDVVDRQVKIGLAGIATSDAGRLTIAYEPVWAIGTGVNATPEQAQEVHAMIRRLLAERFDAAVAAQTRIQYGGSVKPSNAAELLRQEDVDGALVGGASLKASDFEAIARAAW